MGVENLAGRCDICRRQGRRHRAQDPGHLDRCLLCRARRKLRPTLSRDPHPAAHTPPPRWSRPMKWSRTGTPGFEVVGGGEHVTAYFLPSAYSPSPRPLADGQQRPNLRVDPDVRAGEGAAQPMRPDLQAEPLANALRGKSDGQHIQERLGLGPGPCCTRAMTSPDAASVHAQFRHVLDAVAESFRLPPTSWRPPKLTGWHPSDSHCSGTGTVYRPCLVLP
jgi:hypothetical protein